MENIRFHITVKGIVVFKQKVLLMKRVRPSSDGLGYWELPGGGLEYGETPNEALKRELKEETGLTIDVVKPAYTFTKIRKDYQTVGIGYLVMLLSHIGYQKQADALEAALDKCMFEEKKLVITGRADGCTLKEYTSI